MALVFQSGSIEDGGSGTVQFPSMLRLRRDKTAHHIETPIKHNNTHPDNQLGFYCQYEFLGRNRSLGQDLWYRESLISQNQRIFRNGKGKRGPKTRGRAVC